MRGYKLILDGDLIESLYTEKGIAYSHIAKMLNVSAAPVRKCLVERGIKIRERHPTAWNTGLTKLTDSRVANVAMKISKAPRSSSWNSGLTKETDERVAKVSTKVKKSWDNEDTANRRLASSRGAREKPNKLEKRLIAIIEKYKLPLKYVGDGQVVLGRMNPDFININGKKEVVELFGDYWHSKEKIRTWKETELGRIMAYKSFGFNCIVIWEHEIKNLSEDQIIARLGFKKLKEAGL